MARHSRSVRLRKTHRKSRRYSGGQAPVNYANPGPMNLNLAQGQQFAEYHKYQHGGMAYGPYPGAVDTPSELPADLVASAKLLPLNQAFAEIRGMQDGGKRKKGRKSSRKTRKHRKAHRKSHKKAHRKGSRKAHRKAHRKSHRKAHRKGSRKQRGGLYRWGGGSRAEMNMPMLVSDESKMLIPARLQEQAGLNPEWALAKDPMSFAPLK